MARDRNYEGISWKSWPTRADKVSRESKFAHTLGRDACDFGRDPKVFSKVGKRARRKLILREFGKESI